MDAAELDIALNELEVRVERLRALYEQYFLGIERLEPTVPRKDVDRRIWQLKRQKIRNTAKRFKLQTIVQRYNTFQQYWQRICREIERGTYRRHVLRAERATTTVSDVVAQKERAKLAEEAEEGALRASESTANELADMLARDVDAEQEFAKAVAAAEAPLEEAEPAARRSEPKARGAATSSEAARSRLETLDLELEGLERSSLARPAPDAPSPARKGNLLASLGRREPESSGAPPAPQLQREKLKNSPRPARALPTNKSAGPKAQPAPTPRPRAVSPTQAAIEAPAARPTRSRAASRATSNSSARAAGLTDRRIAELHQQLLAAKQSTKEAGKVSVAGLAKSLRAAESKLKRQHKDRRIDFDVVIKNGKAVVKPIVR